MQRIIVGILAALGSTSALSHNHPAYAHDGDIAYRNPDWMALLDDGTRVDRLTLPGTHDSMSFYGGDIVATQTLPLATQLAAGVRAFDIRLRATTDRLTVHHGPVYQNASFDDVLEAMSAFLRAHPRETLLMRVKEEYSAEPGSPGFDTLFAAYAQRYAAYLAAPDDANPALGELRGKIVILQNFSSAKRYGLDYQRFNIQDQYILRSNWDLYPKWEAIKAQLDRAAAAGGGGYINYLSGAVGALPYFVASGHSSPASGAPRLATGLTPPGWQNSYPDFPRVACVLGVCSIAFEGSNVLSHDYLLHQRPGYAGIVMADFPGPGLIDALIQLNLRPCLSWSSDGRATQGDVYRYPNPYTQTVDYFRSLHHGAYGPFPSGQTSNADWQYLGHASACRSL